MDFEIKDLPSDFNLEITQNLIDNIDSYEQEGQLSEINELLDIASDCLSGLETGLSPNIDLDKTGLCFPLEFAVFRGFFFCHLGYFCYSLGFLTM